MYNPTNWQTGDTATAARMNKIESGIENNELVVASVYSSSSTYSVGDFVIYNNTLYECTTAISTAEEWTAAHWTASDFGTSKGMVLY